VLHASKRYALLARTNGLTPTQLALAWCYSRWFVTSTIIGATKLAQLQENIDAWSISLNSDLIQEIDKIHWEMCNPAQ
jgi:aryl-alcohol dehydrogenase-like predicted oxidoreductase